jgi:hypothetical protein
MRKLAAGLGRQNGMRSAGLLLIAKVGTALRTAQTEIVQVVVIHVRENTPVAGALAAGVDKGSKG